MPLPLRWLGVVWLALFAPSMEAAPKPAERPPAQLPGGWVYAWGDEFNGSKLDAKKWTCERGVVRNPGSSQAYTKACVSVERGRLVITSRQRRTANATYRRGSSQWNEQIKDRPFASGSVTTKGTRHFEAPGRLEIRARLPKAKGAWPAIWTMHVNQHPWPANGEIDILEHISQEPNLIYSIFRWGEGGSQQEHKVIRTTAVPDSSTAFHLYVLEWDEETMRILIDDQEVGRVRVADADYPDGSNPLKTPCYLIINTALGGQGTWPEPADGTGLPARFEIDYVRYYTK